jgi:hypothetical protein
MTTLKSNNQSEFQGWMQSDTHRAEWQSFGAWEIFEKINGAFVRVGQSRGQKSDSLESLVSNLRDSEDADY